MAILRPCRTTAAYEAIPEPLRQLDLDDVERDLEAAGWQTVANARVLLVMRKDVEATVFPTGKVLIKTAERPVAERVWAEVQPVVETEVAARGR